MMKTTSEKNTIKNPVVHFDPTMDERHAKIKMPTKKLDELNDQLRKYGPPPFMKNKPQ